METGMWARLVDGFLRHLVREGTLELSYPDGSVRRYGTGRPQIRVEIRDPKVLRAIVLSPDVGVGEAYMDGTLRIDGDDLAGFLDLALRNVGRQGSPWFFRPLDWGRYAKRLALQYNPIPRAERNVAHHYDLSGALYDLFLDADRQYSCAYFTTPDMSLEAAQEAKKRHIARKLCVQPGMRVLDIGCGWGGMALTLAREFDVEVLGVTLSREQLACAQARAAEAGLTGRVRFELADYRHLTGTFDRIVSVGMFEHVGLPHYGAYFRTIRERLTPEGVALVHTIGRSGPPGITSPWIGKYVFPGGYVPALSEASAAIEKQRLYVIDVEVWRGHYAETLRHWHARFMENIDQARALYDERFCRMWRYYLLGCEMTFRHRPQVVFQFQLSPVQDAVPLTRDYLYGEAPDVSL